MASNGIEVYVKHPSGKNAQYNMLGHQQMDHLRTLVAKEEGVPKEHIRLKYQGKTLDPLKTASAYGVRVETILKAEILVPSNLALIVELPADEKETRCEEVSISNLQPVSALFQKVSDLLSVPVNRVQLTISGRELTYSAHVMLLDAGVSDGIEIKAKVKEPAKTKASSAGNDADKNEVLDNDALQTIMSSFDTGGRSVEVAFSFDTTGSMSCYLERVRTKLRESVTRLLQEIPGIRISLIAHGDYCDYNSYVLRQVDLTSDVNELVNFAETVPSTGGGDAPECYEWVLKKSQLLDWSENSAKALVVIGDLYPHPPSYTDQNINWKDELNVLTGMGVKVYGVQAGNNNKAANFYKEIANVSGGCYVNLANIDVITDMFLAVCYREVNDERLDEFVQEVETAGVMTDERREMFKQLTEKPMKQTNANDTTNAGTRRQIPVMEINDPWWTMENFNNRPLFCYDEQTDTWSRHPPIPTSIDSSNRATPSTGVEPRFVVTLNKKKHRKCIVM